MDLKASKFLYNQLVNMNKDNQKTPRKELISEDEFLNLFNADQLKYVFWYRDTQTEFINEQGEPEVEYIELPDMDLSGQDLSGVRLSRFIPGKMNENGEFVLSIINLENTNAEINMNKLIPTSTIYNEVKTPRYVIDLSKVNFKGCKLFGMLPDEYLPEDRGKEALIERIVVIGKENLDEKYLTRRQEQHLSPQEKKLADNVYERVKKGEYILSSSSKKKPNLTDYDLSDIDEKSQKIVGYLSGEAKLSYTGIPNEILGLEPFKNLPYNQRIEILKEKLSKRDFKFIKHHIKSFDNNFVKKLCNYLVAFESVVNYKKNQNHLDDINEIIDGEVQKLDHMDFYNLFITASKYKNYVFMQKYLSKFDEITSMKAYSNKRLLRIGDFAKEFIRKAEREYKGPDPIEAEIQRREKVEANKTIDLIDFKKADPKLQRLLMDFKIKHHDFDYVANNIGFIRETTSVSTLTYREDVDFSERDRIISKLQEERKKSNLTKEQSQKIDDICKAYIKDIDDTRNKVIAYSVKGNSASTLTIPNQQLEQSKLRYQEESDKSRKLRFLEDYVLEHKELSLEDIKMNFGTMFDDEVIKSTYEAVQYNNNRLRNFYSSRLNIDSQESDNYIKHLPKRYLLRENNPESKDIEENGKEIEVIADICDCFGKTKDVFMLDNRSANFEKKKELFDIGYYAVYQRLMFLFDNRNKLNIDFSNPNTLWALSNSCYQFNRNYVRPLYSKETKRYWKEEHDDMYVEYEFMNARYRVPEDYDTLKANINKVKEAIKNKANNNLGER